MSTPLWFVFFVLAVFLFTPPEASSFANLSQTLSYFFWGYVFVILFNTGIVGIGQSMLMEQSAGTLEQILLAPVNRVTLIAGRWVRTMLTDFIIIVSTAVFVTFSTGVMIDFVNPPLLALVITLFELALLGLGLILAAVTLKFKASVTIVNFAWFGVMIFCGVFFPVSALPQPFSTLSLVIPFTYYVDLIKYSTVATQTLMNPDLELALLATLSALFLVSGWYVFGWMEKLVKKKGQTGFY